jgi:hypothetical protein
VAEKGREIILERTRQGLFLNSGQQGYSARPKWFVLQAPGKGDYHKGPDYVSRKNAIFGRVITALGDEVQRGSRLGRDPFVPEKGLGSMDRYNAARRANRRVRRAAADERPRARLERGYFQLRSLAGLVYNFVDLYFTGKLYDDVIVKGEAKGEAKTKFTYKQRKRLPAETVLGELELLLKYGFNTIGSENIHRVQSSLYAREMMGFTREEIDELMLYAEQLLVEAVQVSALGESGTRK